MRPTHLAHLMSNCRRAVRRRCAVARSAGVWSFVLIAHLLCVWTADAQLTRLPSVVDAIEWASFSEDEFQPPPIDVYEVDESPEVLPLSSGDWTVQWMPDGLIYRSYLASVREPRFASVWTHEKDQSWLWDVTLGGRFALWRYGDTCQAWPNGWEVDMEGAAFPRLDPLGESTPLISADFRFGIPITYGCGPWRFKTGYYHLSSHLGDEYLLANPGVMRSNYSRDALVFGVSYYDGPDYAMRYYGEVTWAGFADSQRSIARPWEFQFGIEYSPAFNFDRGSPFWAVNLHLRQDDKFTGHSAAQLGWQLPRGNSGSLFRIGLEYVNGRSTQASFYREHEERLGFGLWYDY